MQRIKLLTGRALYAAAAMLFLSFLATGTASAQLRGGGGLIEYDVKASSGTLNNDNGEFPLNYTVEYESGEQEDISLDPAVEGDKCRAQGVSDECLRTDVKRRLTTAAAGIPIAIWWFGIRYPIGQDIACTFPDAQGGCWCLCLKWVDVYWWPWQVRPIYIWYYDPCCR